MRVIALAMVVAACHGQTSRGLPVALREACPANHFFDGAACKARGDGAAKIAAGKAALVKQDVDAAKLELDAVKGPLDHQANVTLWEQRGIAAAYVDDEPGASAAFDMLLALDPAHILSYRLSPKATFVFEEVRGQNKGGAQIDVNWQFGQRVGDPVPLDLEVVADPKSFLKTATVFVRTRGDAVWRAADLAVTGRSKRVVLPAVSATKPVSLELYVRGYDDKGNEVLAWADASKPREIPLRYDPPTPWYRKWWVITIAGAALIGGTGTIVYVATREPPDTVGGGVSVK
ncbi:MAG: hypothetical protein M4D80_10635 [Myxococcota bacterium]|nr:hypothetical protein [Deltaproteobacteria bacterium]MDQ3335612.1 hypothetical protein [Myxococcota bacterium]